MSIETTLKDIQFLQNQLKSLPPTPARNSFENKKSFQPNYNKFVVVLLKLKYFF